MIFDSIFLIVSLELFCVTSSVLPSSTFLGAVKSRSFLHHSETNPVWKYLGSYSQTESTINFILEIPVFQFICDVFPVSMAFSMQACLHYRACLLENGSARWMQEILEMHVEKRDKRFVEEALLSGTALYDGCKIVGDIFRGKNDEIIVRLDESEHFIQHREKLNSVMSISKYFIFGI